MRVTVTGADGLLGSNIVRQLLAAGHGVRVFLQEGKKSPTLDGLALERVYGDILEPRSLSDAFAHSQAVIHAAANTSIWPPRSELVRQINVQGTVNAIDAAENAQVDRFVFIGTANSFTPGTKDAPGDETTPYACGKYGLDYMDSKYKAHQLVLEAVRTRGLPALTVNPTFMIGPYDSTPSSGMMLIRLYQGKIPGYTAGGRCWTHVCDVARAVVNACSMGEVGESYIAGNVNLSYGEFFRLAADVIGVSPPKMKTPVALAVAIGTVQSALSAVTRRPPLLSRQAARISADCHYFDPSKARKALAMTATPLEIAVRDCFEWLKANGYLERFA
jgi:dihydroflavonol-4-reductase